ncbi:hypothetical protein GCM10020331_092790 [Ectobacillus funiculus]
MMKDYTAYMITDMLRGVLTAANGTGTDANIPGLDVAGKKQEQPISMTKQAINLVIPPKRQTIVGLPGIPHNIQWRFGPATQRMIRGIICLGTLQKVSHLIFKAMMEKVGTNALGFQQPSSVYRMNQELYIKGEKA